MTTRLLVLSCCALLGFVVAGCPETHVVEPNDGGPSDSGPHDSGIRERDSGPPRPDSGRDAFVPDGGTEDAWVDMPDAWVDPVDAWVEPPDAWVPPPDAWVNPCPACDDGDACNGIEGCDPGTGACLPGTPLDCNDGLTCTVDSCNTSTGCVNAPTDSDGDGDNDCTDCGPSVPSVHHGAAEVCNTVDDNCNGITDEGVVTQVWADCDGDGWAPETAVTFDSCPLPPVSDTGCGTPTQAWTPRMPDSSDYDCGDNDTRAHSGTTAFQTLAIPAAFPEGDFDFNCDFDEEMQFPTTGSCVARPGGCTTTPGWQGTVVPDCGMPGVFIAGCTSACVPSTEARTQACR